MQLLTTLVLCRLHGMMECWNHGEENNGQKRITSVFGSRFLVRLRRIGINFHCFSMNAHISTRDDHPFVAIMAFPDKWLSLFDVEKLFKAQDTTSWPPARRAYGSERKRHWPSRWALFMRVVT